MTKFSYQFRGIPIFNFQNVVTPWLQNSTSIQLCMRTMASEVATSLVKSVLLMKTGRDLEENAVTQMYLWENLFGIF